MIKGKIVTLRELRVSDSFVINSWRNRLFNRISTLGYRGPVTFEIDNQWLKQILSEKGGADIYFGIESNSDEKLIGIIQLNGIDHISGVASCGILIGEMNERGKGLGVDAVRAILFFAFYILNLRKITTLIASFNKQAFKVQRKVGKVHSEGCLKAQYYYNNEYSDLYIQSFFKGDYEFLKNEYSI